MRHPFRSIPIVAFAFTLTACGSPKSFDSVTVRGPMHTQQLKSVNAVAAGDMGVRLYRQQLAFIVDAVRAAEPEKEQPLSTTSAPPTTALVVVAPTTSIDWDCIATAETGANWTMTGSRYSSALGIMNQAVRENASEEVAARILSGAASRDEQIAVGEAIVARFGFDAWAPSTVAKCS